MRFSAFAFAASALVLAACGGEKGAATDSAAVTADTTAMAAPTPSADPAAATATPAPATGTTHEIKMLGDEKGYRFEPANITVKAGDAVKFTFVSGGPHNVAFEEAGIPAAGKAQLAANIPNAAAALQSQMMINPNEEVTISFANLPAGAYNYNCTPHLAMGMKGTITVQ